MHRRLRTGTAALATVLAAAGIYVAVGGPLPHAVNTGPLGAGGGYGQGLPATCSGSLITDGNDAFRNGGKPAVVVHSISLLAPHGMKLLRAYVVLVEPNSRSGAPCTARHQASRQAMITLPSTIHGSGTNPLSARGSPTTGTTVGTRTCCSSSRQATARPATGE